VRRRRGWHVGVRSSVGAEMSRDAIGELECG
jgi:hypothetical protein